MLVCEIIHCKPSKQAQFKLLGFFVAQVADRTASDLLHIQHNSSALFYHQIRFVIEHHLDFEAKIEFDGEIEFDESYFGGYSVEPVGLCLVC